ncbi:protein FAR1-RELATED SEQUENCE 5-like [Camellia sinensis]|uniref:protein FAR1-RELATED SEQUENCE 5-like n=1 Tax=Camellia sinensis TaxID=4442 RepID=UPI001036EDFE|nr:protein FAR1-RELATED SEQUENCE 5-like [Camellia sinensis]
MDPFGCTKFEHKLEDDEVCGNKEELGSHANDPIQSLTKNDVLEMQFNSEEDANDFYNQYAKVVGFSIRKDTRTMQATKVLSRKWVCSRQGQRAKQHLARIDRKRAARALTRVGCDAHFRIRYNLDALSRKWVCSRQGQRAKQHLACIDRKRAARALTRVGCDAHFRIRYNLDVGKYIVTHFNMEHNHPLATSPCVPFLRSHRFVKIPDKAQVKTLHNVGVKTSQIMDLLVQQSGSFANVGFIHKDLHNYIQAECKVKMKDDDAECALAYLCAKADADLYFFYKYDKDQENRLDKLFWADSRSRLDYVAFGDVLVFDTTYKTNAYNKPFVIFAEVNNHFETTIFACSLLVDETIATYTWVLQKLLEAMDNKRPVSVLTDGDMAMHEAIQKVFPSAKHRLCNWHMHRNAKRNVRVDGFEGHFKHLMDLDANEVVFEEAWSKMVRKYGLQNNKWVSDTYNNKGMWAQSYLRGHFFAGMKSSQRCEGMHAFFNEHLKRKLKLFEFVRCFDMALYRLRNKEADAEAKTDNSDPCLTTALQPLEKHAATIFTRRLFLMFRNEIIEEALLIFDGRKEEFDHRIYKFSKYTEFGSTWEVSLCDASLDKASKKGW